MIIFGLFLIAHGWVHLLYIALARAWIPPDENIAWTGESWLLTPRLGLDTTRQLATVAYGATILCFTVAGMGVLLRQPWFVFWTVFACGLSIATILGFWDRSLSRPLDKGLLGILIDIAILILVLGVGWPTA